MDGPYVEELSEDDWVLRTFLSQSSNMSQIVLSIQRQSRDHDAFLLSEDCHKAISAITGIWSQGLKIIVTISNFCVTMCHIRGFPISIDMG